MKIILSALLSCCVLTSCTAQAEILGHDSFHYRGSTIQGRDGGTFWDFNITDPARPVHTGVASDWDVLFGTVGLGGGKFFTADGGAKREYCGITEGVGADESKGYFSDSALAQSVFYRIDMTRGTGADWCGLSSFQFGAEQLFFGLFPDGSNKFSIYDQRTFTPLAVGTVNVNVGQKYTLVVRMDITPLGGAGCQLRLYVDPDLNAAENPTTAVASYFLPRLNGSTALRVASGGPGLVEWDDLTVANAWESLRVHPVTTFADAGPGSLRQAVASAAPVGARVTFPAAESLYAVTSDNRLLRFSRTAPGTVTANVPVSGLLAGESLQGIDFVAATGELFGLGIINPAGTNNGQGRLYRIDPGTGAASRLAASAFSSTLRSSLGFFGFAFDAAAGGFRIVSESRDNLRVRINGLPAGADTTLPGSALLSGIAYAPDRTLFGIASGGSLVRVGGPGGTPSANGGSVTVMGSLGSMNFGAWDGFDIAASGTAWATSLRAGLNRLNRINLTTGLATETGVIGSGSFDITGLAAPPEAIRLLSVIDVPVGRTTILDGPEDSGLMIDGGGRTRLLLLGETPSAGPVTKAVMALRNLTLTGGNSLFPGQIQPGPGGAVSLRAGSLHVDGCTFTGNLANSGGAIGSIGNLKISRSTFAENAANSGAAVSSYDDIRMFHCTVSANTSTVAGTPDSIYGFGALQIDASAPGSTSVLRHCVIAGNTVAASTLGPDLTVFGTVAAHFCLIGNGTGSGIGNGANGSRVGTEALPLPARLAPLGYYGGGSRTMPPLPDSLAVNLAMSSTNDIDQRGSLMNLAPDAGAAEYGGTTDLALYWETDWDADGVPFGLEHATGMDALLPDRTSPNQLAIQSRSGAPLLTFRLADAARPHTQWVVRRSFDLLSWPDEIYSFNGRTSVNIMAPGIFQGTSGSLLSLRDQLPNPPRAFYRLEAQLLP